MERASRLSGKVGTHKCRGARRARSTAQLQQWQKALQHNVSASLTKLTRMAGIWSNQVETAETILPCATLQVTYFLLFCASLHLSSQKIKMMAPSCDDSVKYMHILIHMCVYVPTQAYVCMCVPTYICVCMCGHGHIKHTKTHYLSNTWLTKKLVCSL